MFLLLYLTIVLDVVHRVPDELELGDAGVECAALDQLDPVVLHLEDVRVRVNGGLLQDAQVGLPDDPRVGEDLEPAVGHMGYPNLMKQELGDTGNVYECVL